MNATPEWDSWRGVGRSSLKQIEIAWHLALVRSSLPHTCIDWDPSSFMLSTHPADCIYLVYCRWYPSMPCRSSIPHPRGKLRGLAWGVSRPTPGRIPACTEVDIPPSRRLLLRAVRILLECILVHVKFTESA